MHSSSSQHPEICSESNVPKMVAISEVGNDSCVYPFAQNVRSHRVDYGDYSALDSVSVDLFIFQAKWGLIA